MYAIRSIAVSYAHQYFSFIYESVLLCLLCERLSLLINLNGTKNGLIVMITRNDRMKKKLVSEQTTSKEFSVT